MLQEASPPSALTLFAARPTVSLCDLSGVILHQKWILPFLSEIWCWIFFYSTIFSKKSVFSKKTAKICFGGAFDNFLGKESVLRQKLTLLCYHKWGIEYFVIYQFFPKMCNFLRKRQKTASGAQVPFEGKKASGNENEYKLFYGKWGLEYFIGLQFFRKKAIFLETMGK